MTVSKSFLYLNLLNVLHQRSYTSDLVRLRILKDQFKLLLRV
jgi:hypothetical protein